MLWKPFKDYMIWNIVRMPFLLTHFCPIRLSADSVPASRDNERKMPKYERLENAIPERSKLDFVMNPIRFKLIQTACLNNHLPVLWDRYDSLHSIPKNGQFQYS